jgi:uncharacterized protein YdaU (DUF1376 family)
MKDKNLWFPFHYNDYLNDTADLTHLQHGAYLMCMCAYYGGTKPLPSDLPALYRMVRAFNEDEQAATRYILERFFKLDNGVYRHARIDSELAETCARRERASAKGAVMASARWDKATSPTAREAAKLFDEATAGGKPWQPKKFNQAEAEQITDEELINLHHAVSAMQAQGAHSEMRPGNIPAICFTDKDGNQVIQVEPPSPEQLVHIVAQLKAGNDMALGFGFLSPKANA